MLFSVLLAAAAIAAGAEFQFKGIPFGATEARVKAAFSNALCLNSPEVTYAERACVVQKNTYAGAPATLYFYLKANAVVTMSASFPAREFKPVVLALSEAFGAPDNAARATPHEITWLIGEVIGKARPRGVAPDSADVTFMLKAAIQGLGKRMEEKDRLRSKDL